MTVHPNAPGSAQELAPRIVVVGVGGAGGNAVNNMIGAKLEGVEFLVANTDAQALELSACERRVQLGRGMTRGLGAGSNPEVGRAATEDSMSEILSVIEGAQMVFITAGMGGGTGTGGAPVIAQGAREAGVLTVGVVTKPFHFEGTRRMRVAEAGLDELGKQVDTLIVIPNQNLFRVSDEKTTFADAFRIADEVLHSGVRGVTDLVVMPGLINLDFADIQSVMAEMGKAIMGTGEAEGENRALEAAEAAISNPLLDEISMKGARGVLINIAGGIDLTLFEVDQAANRIREEVDPDANIIFGSVFDQRLEGRMRVSVVATGIETEAQAQAQTETETQTQAQAETLTQAQTETETDILTLTQIVAEAEPGAERDAAVAEVTPPEAGKGSAPEPVSEKATNGDARWDGPLSLTFPTPAAPAPTPAAPAKSAAKPAAGLVGSDPDKAKSRVDREAQPAAGKESAPEPVSEKAANGDARYDGPLSLTFPTPAAGPLRSGSGKEKLRFDPDARPSVKALFSSPATRWLDRRREPVSEKAAKGDARRKGRPSLAAPDPAERILPNGPDRKPPSSSHLLRH